MLKALILYLKLQTYLPAKAMKVKAKDIKKHSNDAFNIIRVPSFYIQKMYFLLIDCS